MKDKKMVIKFEGNNQRRLFFFLQTLLIVIGTQIISLYLKNDLIKIGLILLSIIILGKGFQLNFYPKYDYIEISDAKIFLGLKYQRIEIQPQKVYLNKLFRNKLIIQSEDKTYILLKVDFPNLLEIIQKIKEVSSLC